jgi:hypothetical protein
MGGVLGRFNRHSGYKDVSSSVKRLFVEPDPLTKTRMLLRRGIAQLKDRQLADEGKENPLQASFPTLDVISRVDPSDIDLSTDKDKFQQVELNADEQKRIISAGKQALQEINANNEKQLIAQQLFNKVRFKTRLERRFS